MQTHNKSKHHGIGLHLKHLAVTRVTRRDPVLPESWMGTFPMHPDEKLDGFEQLPTKEKIMESIATKEPGQQSLSIPIYYVLSRVPIIT